MSLQTKIETKLSEALRAKDKDTYSTLRLVVAAIKDAIIAKKIKDTDIGKKVSQMAMKDPKIRKILDDLANKVEGEKLKEDNHQMYAQMGASGIMAGPLAYIMLGMPGMEALQAAIGPVAASVGMYGGTMIAGVALGLLADYMIYKSGALK